MARQPRIEYKGACYHVLSRGDKRENIFHDDEDRLTFVDRVSEVVDKYHLRVHSYVMLDDHFHLLLETPEGNLSRSMHQLNSSYSNWFRHKYAIKGSVFQGRYRSILVEKDGYLMRLSAYIHLRPVRSGKVKKPEDYLWSSYRTYLGKKKGEEWVYTRELLSRLGNQRKSYKKFVQNQLAEGDGIKTEELFGKQSVVGSDAFRRKIARRLAATLQSDLREKPALKSLRRLQPEDIIRILEKKFRISREDLFRKRKGNVYRKLLLYALKKHSDLRLQEIGAMVDMDYVAISQMVRRFILEAESQPQLQTKIDRVDRELRKSRR